MEISYESLVDILEKKFKKVRENVFVLKKIESTGQEFKLVVSKSSHLRKTIGEIENNIISDQKEAEKSIRLFGIVFSPKYLAFLRLKEDILQKIAVQKLKKILIKYLLLLKRNMHNFLKIQEIWLIGINYSIGPILLKNSTNYIQKRKKIS